MGVDYAIFAGMRSGEALLDVSAAARQYNRGRMVAILIFTFRFSAATVRRSHAHPAGHASKRTTRLLPPSAMPRSRGSRCAAAILLTSVLITFKRTQPYCSHARMQAMLTVDTSQRHESPHRAARRQSSHRTARAAQCAASRMLFRLSSSPSHHFFFYFHFCYPCSRRRAHSAATISKATHTARDARRKFSPRREKCFNGILRCCRALRLASSP